MTSLSADGLLNAAPFAYFNAIANKPPLVIFSPTYQGAERSGSTTLPIATKDIAEAINSRVVKPPRVAESPGALECRLERFIELGSHRLVIGEVVMFHLRDALFVDGTVDVERLRPIARLSKNNYTRCGDIFEMNRPK